MFWEGFGQVLGRVRVFLVMFWGRPGEQNWEKQKKSGGQPEAGTGTGPAFQECWHRAKSGSDEPEGFHSLHGIAVDIKIQGFYQKIGFPKFLDLINQNKISIFIIVLSRNGISIEIKIQEVDQEDRPTEDC